MLKAFQFGLIPQANSSSHHNVNKVREYMKYFNKIDKIGKVIQIEKKDLRVIYMPPGTKGGQKANKKKCRVHITHVPTKTIVDCNETRVQLKNYEIALARVREAVDIKLKKEESIFVQIEKERVKKKQEERKMSQEKHAILKERMQKFAEIIKEPDTLKY